MKTSRLALRAMLGATLIGAAGMLALGACSTGGAPASGGHVAEAARGAWPRMADAKPAAFSPDALAQLDARMKEAVDKGQVAGIEYVLIKDGQVQAFKAHGVQTVGEATPMNERTVFRIMSMTKPITGVAMMQLYEKGLWKPDDPVAKFVPEFANLMVMTGEDPATKQPILEKPAHAPTMRELFTHTAGFGYGLSSSSAVDRMFIADHPMGKRDMNALLKRVAEIPLLAQPGTKWSYSIGIDVQGAIVERLSGMSFGDYLKKNLFAPLAMNDTSFWLTEADKPRLASVYSRNEQTGKLDLYTADLSYFDHSHAESGGGGLASTTHDYARFVQMLLNKGELDGRRVLKPETVELMFQNQVPAGINRLWGYGGSISGPTSERSPTPPGTFSWFGIEGTWFWADATNKIGFVGMIQRRGGGGGAGAVNFQVDSAKAVYAGLQK